MEKRIDASSFADGEKVAGKRISKDWNIRFGFNSAMLSAIASAIAVATDPVRIWLIVVAVLTLVVILYMVQQYLWGEEIGELFEGRGLVPAVRLDILLLVVNLAIVAMFVLNNPDRRESFCLLIGALCSW
jgi:hypothetical protein